MVELTKLMDDELMDLEEHAKSTVQLWKSMDKDIRAIALLEENDMYKAYEFALSILDEISMRIDAEREEIFQCQLEKQDPGGSGAAKAHLKPKRKHKKLQEQLMLVDIVRKRNE